MQPIDALVTATNNGRIRWSMDFKQSVVGTRTHYISSYLSFSLNFFTNSESSILEATGYDRTAGGWRTIFRTQDKAVLEPLKSAIQAKLPQQSAEIRDNLGINDLTSALLS